MKPELTSAPNQISTAVLVLVFVLAAIAAPVRAQTFTVLSNFAGSSGAYPYGGLMQDSAGTLYGTTYSGGSSSAGTMFAVLYGAEPVLHSFNGSDGSIPKGGLIRDQSGVLYGTTENGGAYGFGTVFALSITGTLTTLHSLAGGSSDGAAPFGGLVRDSAGNLYSTTGSGGLFGLGTVWTLSPSGTESVLYSFSGPDGSSPAYGSLMLGVCPSIRKSSFKSTTGCVRRGTRLQPVARKVNTRTHS